MKRTSLQHNEGLCKKSSAKNVFVTEKETINQCKPFMNIQEYLVARNWFTPTKNLKAFLQA